MEFQGQEKPSSSTLSKSDNELSTAPKEQPSNNSRSISSSYRISHTDSESSDHIGDGRISLTAPRFSTSPDDDDIVTWEPIAITQTRSSIGSSATRPPEYEVVFEPDDPENPKNWSLWYRGWIIFCVSFSTWGKNEPPASLSEFVCDYG